MNTWVSVARFTAGYGVAQAVPGPLFMFVAYLGAAMRAQSVGAWGAPLALLGIFTLAPTCRPPGAASTRPSSAGRIVVGSEQKGEG